MRLLRTLLLLLCTAWLTACATSSPLSREEMVGKGRAQLQSSRAALDGLPAAWTLDDAVQRALTSHVDFRISQLEAALATGNRRLATLELLPELVVQAGYQRRSAEERITSADKESRDNGIFLRWDMVDFAVAFLRRQELANEALAAEENRRRVAQLTIRDATYAWYQVLAWQQLAPELDALRAEVEAALRQSDEIVRQRLGNPMHAVEYRSALLVVLRRIDQLGLQLDHARDELARLLHLPADMPLRIDPAGAPGDTALLPMTEADLRLWQAAALVNRPELRQTMHESRAQRTGAVRRMVDAAPRILFRTGIYRDDNRFLFNREWEQQTTQLSWDLMRLASLPGLRRNLRLSRELADLREQSVSAAVLSQVSMASKAVVRQQNSWCLSASMLEVDRQRSELLAARATIASLDRLTWMRARLDSLLLRMEAGLDRADLEKSRMTLLQSAGLLDVPDSGDAEQNRQALSALLRMPVGPGIVAELSRVATEFELPSPPAADMQTTQGCGT